MSAYQTMLTRIWDEYVGLTLYELTFKANNDLLRGDEIKPKDQAYMVKRFLDGVASEDTMRRFHSSVRAPKAASGDARQMYPLFFIPPYDGGKKYVTISTVTPKTHILSSNAYELEILRLLSIFAGEDERVQQMLTRTRSRLLSTCFGNFCERGECLETSIVVLRFLGTAFPGEIQWLEKLIAGVKEHLFDKNRHSGGVFYYWLALSELPIVLAKPEIERFTTKGDQNTGKYVLDKLIKRSFVMNSDHDKYASPFGSYVLRNCLSRLDEFAYLKDRKPYISDTDGRIHLEWEPISCPGDRASFW